MDAVTITILLVIAAGALVLLYLTGVLRRPEHVVICAALIAGAFVIRGLCMSHVTLDYEDFLSQWVDYYRQNGGFAALGDKAEEYSPAVVSVYYGEDVSDSDAEGAGELFTSRFPDAEISVVNGGQPVYYYMISIE